MPDRRNSEGDWSTRRRVLDHALGDGLVVAALIAWWLYSKRVPEYIFPSPLAVGKTLARLFTDPALLLHTLSSTLRVVAAVIAATALGSALALLAHYRPLARDIVHGRIKPFLVSFPSIGWALLAIVWFDISNAAVIFVQVAVLLPFCLVNVSEGLKEIDREFIEMATSFTRSNPRTFRKAVWPLLYPFVIAGMRMSSGVAWKIALIAEVFGSKSGLGHLMYQAEETADTPMIFATCLAIVVLFALGDRFIFEPLSHLYRGRPVAAHEGIAA
ncbi:MAG: ABC transporter permease subunit [Betaproteobacteria bacterium]|nr:ABC transporter permease subunit [Betaproteobacteria bacterium]MBI2961574.1 ABC transporter permease subunit [Betaproteobacteria bacterium]